MAVPYFKRSVSSKEYYYTFKNILQKEIIDLLKRDFSIDKNIPDWNKQNPNWLIKQKRTEILKSLNIISTYISRANFYPQDFEKKKIKMTYQDRAIQECFALYDHIQLCSEIFSPLKSIKSYTKIAKDIKDEIEYLKYWRKFTDKIEYPEENEAL